MLTLQIKEKEIENLTPEEEFVRGTVGAKCQINFDEFWQGYEKYIVFKRVGYEPINIMVNSLENEIEIPYTILAESGEFKIGVFGITETETLPTLYSKDIKILYGTDTHGTTPPTYIPSEIDQLRLSKQDKLVSGENIKYINGESILGSGNIKIQVEVDQIYDPDSTNAQSGKAVAEAVELKADKIEVNKLKGDLGDIEKDFNKFLVPNNRNLLNPIYVKSDKYLNDDGIAIDNSYGWGVSGFVEVEAGKIYSTNFQLTQCFYYDSNKNKIAKVNGTEIDFNEKYTTDIVPINAKYIRFSMYPSNPHYLNGTMMMIEGSGIVAYVPFERTLKAVNDAKDEIESIIGNRKVLNWEDGKLLVNGVVGTSDVFALAMVDVYPNEKIIVKTGLGGTATVTLFDSDGGIIKNYTYSDGESADGSNDIRKLTISVPSNAKTIGVSCFKNALSTSDAYVDSFDIYNTVMNKQSETEDVEDLYYFACGDSITHANHSGISTISDDDKYCPIGGSEGFTDYKKKGYPYYIAKKNNLKWFNYGIGGSTLTDISVNGTKYHPFSEENGRYTKLDSSVTPNYISIFFGWNDGYWGRYAQAEKWLKDTYGSEIYYPLSTSLIGTTHSDGTPYATQIQYDACNSYTETIDDKSYTGLKLFSIKHIGNINSYDITTWYGAWNTVLEYMIKKYPYAKIMPIVPYNPEWYAAEVITKELREAVRLISKKWGLAYFDFDSTEHQSLFTTPTQFTDNEYLAKYRVDNLLADGLHPNTHGYKYIANMIGSKLMSI